MQLAFFIIRYLLCVSPPGAEQWWSSVPVREPRTVPCWRQSRAWWTKERGQKRTDKTPGCTSVASCWCNSLITLIKTDHCGTNKLLKKTKKKNPVHKSASSKRENTLKRRWCDFLSAHEFINTQWRETKGEMLTGINEDYQQMWLKSEPRLTVLFLMEGLT